MAEIKLIKSKKLPFDAQAVANSVMKVLAQTGKVSVEVDIVSEEYIKRVNNEFRGINSVTDVLSFPTLDGIRYKDVLAKDYPLDKDGKNRVFIGSIIICLQRAKTQAIEYNHSLERELSYLFCHGLLHLFGYDHVIDKDDEEMRALATKALEEIQVLR